MGFAIGVGRRLVLCCALTGALVFVLAADALALSGKPINAGTPLQSGPPAVAVDSAGTAYVAWANTKDLPPNTTDVVQYCVLPPAATACAHSGTLTPADGASNIDGVQVLADGSTIVILADIYGAQGNMALDYTPEQEWQSTDGGATFTLVNAGLSVSSGTVNADTAPLSAVVLPGTNVLGYGWNTAGGSPPTFNAFPLTSPPECSAMTCAAGFASLSPNTNPDQIGNAGGQFAAESGTSPGVLGIFNTDFTNGPLGCSTASAFGTAFAYGSGPQSAANSYDVSPGAAGSAWRVPVTQADCDVEYPAVGGGPSGFGVVEDNEGTGSTVYHRFDSTKHTFDTPEVTIAKQGEESPAVSQDGSGGVYVTYLAGAGGPINLAYSKTGGTTWAGPVVLEPDTAGSDGNVTSSVGSNRQGWAAWTDNGSVFAQQFDAADASPVATAAASDSGTSTATSVTITITCSSVPCTVTVTITIDPTVAVSAAHKPVKHVTVTLASGRFTITGRSKLLSVRLTKAGQALLKADHGRVGAQVTLSEKIGGQTVQATHNLRITPKR